MENKLPRVIGTNNRVLLKTGRQTRVVLLNNAATTPPLETTLKEVNDFLVTYSALGRGGGPHASITQGRVMDSVNVIRKFFNAGPDKAILFVSNTTAAINLLARTLDLTSDDVILTSPIEHTSNILPWRYNSRARLIECAVSDDGSFDYNDLENKAKSHSKGLRLIAINAASNTTGYVPDLSIISAIARKHGAMLFIDAAQLAPKRSIDMENDGIDALAMSGHKLYAPFGTGALIMPIKMLGKRPIDPGGGTVDMVSAENTLFVSSAEERHQPGTWNSTGIVALAASCKAFMDAGWDNVLAHERGLVEYAAKKLSSIKGLLLHVPLEAYVNEDRVGNFPFNVQGMQHALVSSILGHEYGIETRSGTICNHRMVRRWFKTTDTEQAMMEKKIAAGDRLATYGIVRASLGIHNTTEDIDLLASALENIAQNGAQLNYSRLTAECAWAPAA